MDQATNTIHIIALHYDADDRDRGGGNHDVSFEVIDRIEFDERVVRPHMIDFTSDYRYAFVANTVSGNVAVIRVEDREIIEVIETGPGSHMAAVAPGDEVVHVDVIADGTVRELLLDLDAETFEIGRTIVVSEAPAVQDQLDRFTNADGELRAQPICHDYTRDGRYAYVTLGPGLADGGLVILDTESFEIVRAYPPDEIAVNCGTILSPDGSRMFVNGGSLDTGVRYAFDTDTHEPVTEARSSRGLDAHGVALTPDGGELWMVNRATSDAIVIDPQTKEVIEYVPFVGQSPDILVISPEGRFAFVTLRGPEPLSGPHAVRGETPGVAVIDVASRTVKKIIHPEEDFSFSDFHGIGLVPRD